MERLTYKLQNQNGEETGTVVYDCLSSDFSGPTAFPQTELEKCALKKLAAYEDIGLTPEEITDMEYRFSSFLCEMTNNRLSKTNYTVEAMVSCADDCREQECEDCWERKELSRYQELEAQGLLVALPNCKLGDTLYAIWPAFNQNRSTVYCAELKEVRIIGQFRDVVVQLLLEPIQFRGRIKEYRLEDFGKLLFATFEEAQAALAGGET